MVKKGYKQTEVGVIPEDWECVPLLSKCSLLNGLTYNPENVSRYGLLVIRSSNIQGSHLVFSDNVYVDLSVDSEKLIKKDDIIVCVRNGSASLIGKCAKAENDYFATFGSFMAVLRGNCNDFIFQRLQQGTIQKHRSKNSGATINQITNGDLKTIFIPFPSDEKEQYSIAEALSDVDGMISSLEKLIAKYKSIKTACLQQMFPQNGETVPRMRLPGFTGAWEQRKLGEVIRLNGRIGFRGYTEKDIVSKDDGGVLTFSPTNIVDNKLTTNCKNTYITRFKYDESPEIKIHNGDILFVKTGSTLGKSALVTGLSEDATLNPQVVVMRTNNLNVEFLAAMLVTNAIISQVNSAKIGGAVPTLTETRIKDFDVAIPVSEAEKEQIGQFFSQLGHLITLHQRKLEKIQKIKQGMMQQLLTGKIRLK